MFDYVQESITRNVPEFRLGAAFRRVYGKYFLSACVGCHEKLSANLVLVRYGPEKTA